MRMKPISVVLPDELKQKAVELADKKRISLNALVRIAIAELIDRSS